MKGLNANAKAQAMMLLKMACNAGATAQALSAIHACSALRAGENAVDWTSAVSHLQSLVAQLPTETVASAEHGLELVEDEDDDELAA